MRLVIDAEKAIAGRLASYVAKQALLGKEIVIVNSEKAIISGNRKDVLEKYLRRRRLGGTSLKSKYPSRSDHILKRIIRGMLDHRKGRGGAAFKNIKCYIGVPDEYKDVKKIKSGRGGKGLTIGELSSLLK